MECLSLVLVLNKIIITYIVNLFIVLSILFTIIVTLRISVIQIIYNTDMHSLYFLILERKYNYNIL